MSDSYNVTPTLTAAELAGNMDPTHPGLTLADSVANNSQTQAQQAQLIQQAIEHTKQARLTTQEDQNEFDSGAYLSKQGLMQKQQALGQLKIVMQKQGMSDADQASIMQTAQETFPDEMDGTALWRWFSALREPKPVAAIRGQTFQATADDVANGQEDSNGNPVVEGQGYITDSDGNWIRSGQSQDQIDAQIQARADLASKAQAAKGGNENSKELIAFGKEIDGMLKSRFGSIGMLATTVFRSDRALNTLASQQVLTKQDLNNISTDIAAIYQGGVPGQVQIMENAYGTSLTNLMETLRHYTGVLSGFGMNQQVLGDTKTKLISVLTDMRNSAIASIKQTFEGVAAHYPELSITDPAVMNVIEQTMAGLASGLMNSGHQVMPPTGTPPMTDNTDPNSTGEAGAAPAAAAPTPQMKTKAGTVYTVNP